MPLDKQQVKKLLSLVASTREDEIPCDECLAGMAEFVDSQLVGAEIPLAVRRIADHIASCPDCAEEYGLLLELVSGGTSASSNQLRG